MNGANRILHPSSKFARLVIKNNVRWGLNLGEQGKKEQEEVHAYVPERRPNI